MSNVYESVYPGKSINCPLENIPGIPYLDVDFHSHGAWTDYKLGEWNIEHFIRFFPRLARELVNKGIDVSGLVDIQAEGFSERRFKGLLHSLERRKDSVEGKIPFVEEIDENSGTIFFKFPDDKKVAVHRVQEVLTNIPKIHCLAVGLHQDKNIYGGRSLADTAKEIKDEGGYVIIDHPYFATFKGKSSVQLNRQFIDALEFNGQINTDYLGSFLESCFVGGSVGGISAGLVGLLANSPIEAGITGAIVFGGITGFAGLSLSAYMNHCNSLAIKRAKDLALPLVGSSDANTAESLGIARTRVHITKEELHDKPKLIKNIMGNIKNGNYVVLQEENRDTLWRMARHIRNGFYSQLRGKLGWFYENEFYSAEERKMGLPSA